MSTDTRPTIDTSDLHYHRNGVSGHPFFCQNAEGGVIVRFADLTDSDEHEVYLDAGSAVVPVAALHAADALPGTEPRGVLCEIDTLSRDGLRAFVREAGAAPPTFKGNVYTYGRMLVVADPAGLGSGQRGDWTNPRVAVFDLARLLDGDIEHNTWRGDEYADFARGAVTAEHRRP